MKLPLRHRPGFLLLEVMVGICIFAIFVTAIGLTMLYGQEGTIMAGDRIRATHLVQETFEVARAIRDGSFAALTSGAHGWRVNSSGLWAFTGSQLVSTGSYTSTVTISSRGSDWVALSARTAWKHGYNRSGAIVLTSELTNWRTTQSVGNWSSLTVDGTVTPGGTPTFVDLAIYSGSYVFAASQDSTGLYVMNTTTTTSPTRINSSFSLGYAGWDVAVRGTVLFVATSDPNQEIRAYRITAPSTFSSAQLLGSYNVPGTARIRSLALNGNMLYAGATASSTAGQAEFYAFNVTSGGTITLRGSLEDNSSSVEMIALSGTAAYLASSMDTGELRVVNTESGSNPVFVGTYNLSDRTLDALAIATSGTAAIIGTQKGTSIQEVVMFHTGTGGSPSATYGPWYHEGSGSIVGIDTDPSRCFGFLAALSGRKALQVFNMRDTSALTELTTYTSTSGFGRSVLYDMRRDRLILATDQSIIIFRPGASTGTCP